MPLRPSEERGAKRQGDGRTHRGNLLRQQPLLTRTDPALGAPALEMRTEKLALNAEREGSYTLPDRVN
jgi:hypothetical protein